MVKRKEGEKAYVFSTVADLDAIVNLEIIIVSITTTGVTSQNRHRIVKFGSIEQGKQEPKSGISSPTSQKTFTFLT